MTIQNDKNIISFQATPLTSRTLVFLTSEERTIIKKIRSQNFLKLIVLIIFSSTFTRRFFTEKEYLPYYEMKTIRAENIFQAAALNSTPGVQYFVGKSSSPARQVNSKNQTAAHLAAENRNLEMLQYLLALNAFALQVVDIYGNTVFLAAVENGALNIVKFLVEKYNQDVYQRNKLLYSKTAIHIAAEEGELEILKYFVEEKNADVNVQNDIGEPPIFLAAERNQMDTVRYLVEKANANVTALDCKKDNILFISAKTGDLEIPKYLLDERKIQLDVNWKNEEGYTAVFLAVRFQKLDFLEYLVEAKQADINIADKNGKTPLHEAVISENFAIVKYLVSKGADVELLDNNNKTAVHLAKTASIRIFLKENSTKRNTRCAPSAFNPGYLNQITWEPSTGAKNTTLIGAATTAHIEVPHINIMLELLSAALRYANFPSLNRKFLQPPRYVAENTINLERLEAVNALIDFEDVR